MWVQFLIFTGVSCLSNSHQVLDTFEEEDHVSNHHHFKKLKLSLDTLIIEKEIEKFQVDTNSVKVSVFLK